MKPIIQEIFYGNVCGMSNKSTLPKKALDKELKAYDAIYTTLTDEQKNNFQVFYSLLSDRNSYEMKEAYTNGFKTGVLIALEISGFQSPIEEA